MSESPAPPPAITVTPGRSALVALQVALVGSVLLGIFECAAACTFALKHYGDTHWPWMLIVAAAGKAVANHVVMWCPLFAVAGWTLGWWLQRRPPAPPEGIFAGLFTLLVGWVIARCDLMLAEAYTPRRYLLIGVAASAAAVLLVLVLRWWVRRGGTRTLRRALNVATVTVLLVSAAVGVVFVRSPLFHPAEYRADPGVRLAGGSKLPNVLWIVMDTVRRDHTSLHGYALPTTPRLTDFSREAIVFDHAISNGMWTLPNHAAMFSGRPLRAHGADFRHPKLDERFTTVAEVLRDHGYATAAFSNNPWVSQATDLTRGFDSKRILYHLRHINRTSVGWIFDRMGWPPLLPWLDEDFGGAMTNALVAEWLDTHAGHGQPMFVFINYMDAHLPYRVPARYRAEFLSPAQVRRSFDLSLNAYGRLVDTLDRRFNFEDQSFLAMADREILKGMYDAGIRYLDDRVSEALALFRTRGLLENTLVVIVSDHGEYLDQHGQWAHRMQVYQDLLNVVIMLRRPGATQGTRVETPVQLSELYGTVIAAAVGTNGLPASGAGWPTRDLFAVAADRPDPRRIAVSEYGGDSAENMERIRLSGDAELQQRAVPQVAAQDARFKLIVSVDGRQELYDLIADPREQHNLIGERLHEAEWLGGYLAEWHTQIPQYAPPAGEAPPELEPDVIRALKSLGYLGDE